MTSSAIERAQSGALLVERPELGTLEVAGPDARSWLHGVLTCDVKSLEPGQGAWGLVLTKQGKILADVNVVVTSSSVWLSVPQSGLAEVHSALSELLIMEDADLYDRTQSHAWLTVHGPGAARAAGAVAARTEAAAAAIDWTGLGGAALVVNREAFAQVVAELNAEPGVALASNEEWQRVRIERLVPEYGTDFSAQDNPHEASLDRRAVSWTKGCYLGQEAVCMQDMRGKVKRRLITVSTVAAHGVGPGAPVELGTEQVGAVTSSVFVPETGALIAIARVATKALGDAGPLTVAGRPVTIVRAPAS